MAIEGVIPEHCCFDLEPAVMTSTSTVPAPTSLRVVRDGDLDLTSPTTCLSLCPVGAASAVAATMMASMDRGAW
jgi:hypothetical protein